MTVISEVGLVELLPAAMQAQGYALLPGVFDKALVAQARGELDRARQAEEQRYGSDALAGIGQRGYVCDVVGMGPATRSLLDQDVIHRVLAICLQGEALLSIAQGICLDPGMGRGVWPRRWHADMFQIRQAIADPTFCFGVNCLVVLDDTSAANGATCVVAGSQAFTTPRSDDGAEMEPLAVNTAAPAGSLLVMDGGTWHAAGTNTTDSCRRVLKLLFVRRWIRPQVSYRAVVPADVAQAMSPSTATLLGLRPGGDL